MEEEEEEEEEKAGHTPSALVMPLGELISRLEAGSASGLYLYDASLPQRLPALLEYLYIPRHVAHCFLQVGLGLGPGLSSGPR